VFGSTGNSRNKGGHARQRELPIGESTQTLRIESEPGRAPTRRQRIAVGRSRPVERERVQIREGKDDSEADEGDHKLWYFAPLACSSRAQICPSSLNSNVVMGIAPGLVAVELGAGAYLLPIRAGFEQREKYGRGERI
jgi:hypothetical protein